MSSPPSRPSSDPSTVSTDFVVVIGPREWGKTEFMAHFLPMMAPPDRTTLVSPVSALGERMNHDWIDLHGSDRKACSKVFGGILDSGYRQVVGVDEFDEYCPGGVTGATGGYCCEELYRLVNYARNKPWQIGMIVSARGTADVTTNCLRAANYVFLFQTTEPRAIEYVRQWMKQGDIDFEQIVRNLPKYVALGWEPGNYQSKFTGFWKVVEGRIRQVTPDDPEWDPEWKSTNPNPESETTSTTDPNVPPSDGSTDTAPTPGSVSGPSSLPSADGTA